LLGGVTFPGGGKLGKSAKVVPAAGEPPGQLYNLDDNPRETMNLYANQPKIVAELNAMLAPYRPASGGMNKAKLLR